MAMAQRGLGKGLDALLKATSQNTAEDDSESQKVTEIALDSISASKFQPRRNFDAEPLEELSQSIKEQGVLQPILVRTIPGRPNQYELIAGERRLRASQLAGIKSIPAIIRSISDEESMLITIVENLQREDLNSMDEAQGLFQLQQHLKLNQEELAAKIGKSRPAIANSLRLLQLPETMKEHVRSGLISAGHARALLSINDSETQQTLHRLILDQGLSVREAEAQAVHWKKHGVLAESNLVPAPKNDRHSKRNGPMNSEFVPLQQQMSHYFQTKVSVRGDRSKGQIVLSFNSEEQFKNLIERLGGAERTENTTK